jgi:hypothetical protein
VCREGGEKGCDSPRVSDCSHTTDEFGPLLTIHGEG